jgi:hypothetical protein
MIMSPSGVLRSWGQWHDRLSKLSEADDDYFYQIMSTHRIAMKHTATLVACSESHSVEAMQLPEHQRQQQCREG